MHHVACLGHQTSPAGQGQQRHENIVQLASDESTRSAFESEAGLCFRRFDGGIKSVRHAAMGSANS